METLKIISSPIVTLFVGGLAIYLYYKQKIENKRDAAKLILQEIRYAEQQIRSFRDSGSYPLSTKLLPTNNWHNKINLFIKDLNESEIDLISRFYSTASYIDTLVNKISDQKNNSVIPVAATQVSVPFSPQPPPVPGVPLAIPIGLQTFEFVSQTILLEISNKVEFINNTAAIEKLRNIARNKVKWIF